jgi:hypothetical protein
VNYGLGSAKLAFNVESRLAVIRRGLQFYLLSLSLLALAPVALACNAPTPSRDCCPAGPRAPCESHSGPVGFAPTTLSCCVAVPGSLAVDTVSLRSRSQSFSSGTPALVSMPAWPASIPAAQRLDLLTYRVNPRFALDPEPVYLLTRRLRL